MIFPLTESGQICLNEDTKNANVFKERNKNVCKFNIGRKTQIVLTSRIDGLEHKKRLLLPIYLTETCPTGRISKQIVSRTWCRVKDELLLFCAERIVSFIESKNARGTFTRVEKLTKCRVVLWITELQNRMCLAGQSQQHGDRASPDPGKTLLLEIRKSPGNVLKTSLISRSLRRSSQGKKEEPNGKQSFKLVGASVLLPSSTLPFSRIHVPFVIS